MDLGKITVYFALITGVIIAVIPQLLWCLGWLAGKCFHYTLPYAPWGWTSLVLAITIWGMFAYGFWVGRWQYVTTHHTIVSKQLPQAFNGYKIVHISDLHLSTFDDGKQHLEQIVDSINALSPDLICFTGDLVSISTAEAIPYGDILQRLHAKDGIMSILGNHDLLIYNRSFVDTPARMAEVERLVNYQRYHLGWNVLRNTHHTIHRGEQQITVVGVDNIHGAGQGFATTNLGNLNAALSGTQGFQVLLTHDPSHWEAEVLHQTHIPLTLSGHTHSAQVRLGKWNPASWMFRQSWGLYTINEQSVYVNAGLGCTLPIRLHCPAEITEITLKCE